MHTKSLSVSIVLPNWNGIDLLGKNLPVVIAAAPDTEIIVADDASTDGSVGMLEERFPGIKIVENRTRQGYAGNINSGVAKSHGDIVVLLNTDVRPEKDFLTPLLERFKDSTVAAVGCLEKSHESSGIVLRGRGVAVWRRGYYIHSRGETDSEDTAWVSGGSCAYRRTIWEKLGGMDTMYNPFYWEDIDLSYQVRKAGYSVLFEKGSVVSHFHEEGKIKTEYKDSEIKRIVYRNQFLFHWKNISDPKLLFLHSVWTPVNLIRATVSGDTAMIAGYMMAVWKMPALLRSRIHASRYWKRYDMDLVT